MGLTDDQGDVVELYAYNPYGEVEYLDDLGNTLTGSNAVVQARY